jgi:transaldolase
VTSNPAIFEKAIGGDEYTEQILEVADELGGDARRVYEALAVEDVRRAADVLAPVHRASGGADGFVSLEVAPDLAHDTEATLAEARRLHRTVERPNLMIKVPGTAAGVPAIRRLLAEGVPVNITLLFAREAYAEVAEAHLAALEERLERGLPVDGPASVASFFVSRIDTLVDQRIEEGAAALEPPRREDLLALRGRTAIANAKLAYRDFQGRVDSERWRRLAAAGARPQRLLWASTSTKNPAYRDTLYVEELIGPQTIAAMPEETIRAFQDHGRVERRLESNMMEARLLPTQLAAAGVDYDDVVATLEREGIEKFVAAFGKLLEGIVDKRRDLATAA